MRSPQGIAWLGAMAASFLGACTNNLGPSVSAQGMVAGMAVPTTDVVGHNETSGTGAAAVTALGVTLSSIGGLCSAIQSGTNLANLRLLSFGVTLPGSTVATGAYAIGQSGASVVANYSVTDANCASAAPVDIATKGSVTFDSIGGGQLGGKFDLTFPDGHVTGDFTAPVCGAIPTQNPKCTR